MNKETSAEESLETAEEESLETAEEIENKYCARIANRIGDKISEALTSIIESLKDKLAIKNETSNDTSQGKEIALDKLAYLDKLTSRMETFNQNFSKLSNRESKRDIVTNYITSYKDLVANIKLHQIKNIIESFTEAENDFAQKYGDNIRIEEEIKENV
ncbi:hypothetical protein [Borrelia sp. RT1S]|uniref:hypothetical protein n=1 Tax=Borrelia sp. RT1S TaxID=2898580 RepID=UPI001E39EE97|nr:hypothetical protein [Borrelia sp. RT1S]UGQ17707.1 hypothetical protein LSO05_04590 [Borrelia sp. RT1S]UGQ17798.1 hypothetical protein LSO05_05050 [Borrelia sp. RT1S]